MLGRPPNLPRRRGRPSDIDLDDIQGNVLRGYTMPAAAYLWLRIVDVPQARRADDADAAVRGDGRRRGAQPPATAMNVAFTFAGLSELGLPDDVLASFPDGLPGRHGGARRAARRPRAFGAGDVGVRGRARARQRLRRRRRAPARGAGRRSSPPTPRAASSSCTCSAPRRWRAARITSGSSTGSPSPPSRARASRRGPVTVSPTARAAGARWRRARCCSATATRTARCRWHRSPRSTATARSSSTASWRWTSAAFRRFIASQDAYPGGPDLLAAKIVGRWPDGTPLAVSP